MLAQIDHQIASEMAPPSGPEVATAYLEDVRALAREIETGIAAIATNALPLLQQSVARQEMLCTLLAARTNRAKEELRIQGGSALAEFEGEVGVLGAMLRTYDTLLKRCGKTNSLLLSLCKSYTGTYGAVRGLSSGGALSFEV
jgi:hypothetical protein